MIRRLGHHKRPHRERIFVTANHQIKFPELRVMDEYGQTLGVMTRQAAIEKAFSENKDLVLITQKANPPIAKIIEFSKYKYQLSQKKAQERKKSHPQDIKEIRLRPFIDENDLAAKIRKAQEFLKKKHKVRLSMELKGRAITKQDLAHQILDRFVAQVEQLAQIETPTRLIGKKILLQLMPKKKK